MYSFHGMTMCSDTNCASVPIKEGENEFGGELVISVTGSIKDF